MTARQVYTGYVPLSDDLLDQRLGSLRLLLPQDPNLATLICDGCGVKRGVLSGQAPEGWVCREVAGDGWDDRCDRCGP